MTFKDIKIGTILYEVIIEKSHFDIVERTVDSVSHTEKKTVFSLVPKEGFKDWVYHARNNQDKVISRQNHHIFTEKVGALKWLRHTLEEELSYHEKVINCIRKKLVTTDVAITKYDAKLYKSSKYWCDMLIDIDSHPKNNYMISHQGTTAIPTNICIPLVEEWL